MEGLKEAHEGEGDIDLIMEVGFERIAQEEVGINKETDKKIAHFDSTASVINTSSPILRKQTNRVLYPLSVVGFAIVLSLALYFWSRSQCMCWQVDQYLAVDCDAEIIGTPIIALNADKLKNFKKINRPDTLTEEHVNKVWYSKISNKVEFFTGPGLHPVHNHSALKAATKHIINTYATKNTANGRSIQH